MKLSTSKCKGWEVKEAEYNGIINELKSWNLTENNGIKTLTEDKQSISAKNNQLETNVKLFAKKKIELKK